MSNAELAKRWEDIQKRTFTKWVNSHLMKRSTKVEDVQTDFQDGIRLIQLLEVIGGESIGAKYNMNPKMKIQKIENINKGLRYLGSKVRLVGQTAEHIHDGDLKMILGMIWIIILRFSIQDISEEELSAKEALLLWCQKRTKGHAHCDINNFHMSWQDGMAFCALIHAHRPDLIPYGDLDPSNPEANLKLAFDVAEKELGIPPLLDIEDIVGVPKPDERSVMTYVSQFYHAFSASRKNEVAGRRIGNLVDTTKQNDALKAQYDDKSRALSAWITATTEKMQSRDFGNSIESVKSSIGAMDTYKTEEKPPKAAEKLQLVALFNNIGAKLKSAGRPAFEPEVSVEATAGLWAGLNAAEQERYTALRAELAKQQQLAVLNRRFQNKAGQLEEWIAKKDTYLGTEEQVDSVAAAQTKITLLGAYSSEYERSEARLNTMNELAEKIISLEAANADEVKARSTAITESWKGLKGKEDEKRTDLQAKLEKQQEMERLRIQFANEGKDFTRFVKDTVSKVGASNFGDSLESVVAYKETMDADDERITSAADEQRSSLAAVSQQLTELGVTDNKYSPLTDEDITTLRGQVDESLTKRHDTYAAEVQRQEAMEAKRKEFAAAAEKFVANVSAAREAVKALEGEPQPLIEAVRAEYNDGAASAAEFQELQKLQDEMAQMGINDNKHTKFTLPMLEAQTRQLAKFVKDYITSLEKEHRLRGEYEERAAAVGAWVDSMEPRLKFESDNTLEGVRTKKTEWTTYKTTERAQKNVEHLHVRGLYDQISALLTANGRPAFSPPAELTVESLKEKETKLDEQERAYEAAMAEELARQERLDSLVSKYDAELDELHSFAEEKSRYLDAKEKVDSLDTARLKLMHLDVFDKEHSGTQARVAEVKKLHDEIESLNYVDHSTVAEKHAGLQSRWGDLTSKSASKRSALEADQKVQQEKEDLRIAFADKAKAYAKFVKDSTESAEETNFGLTLEAVQAFKEELDQQDASILESSSTQVQALEELQQKMEEREVYDNKYTTISIAAVRTSSKQLQQSLEQRQGNYSTELKRQLAMDAKKKEFAAAAASFIEWCDSRKTSMHALEGEPEGLIAAIGDAYKEGQPEEDRLAEIDTLLSEMTAMGITENRHTELNMPALRARADQLGQEVKNMVSKLKAELDLKTKYVSDTAELGTWIRETHAKREGTVAPKQVTTVRSVTRTKMVPQKKTITVTEKVPEKKMVTKVRKIPGVRKETITRTVPVTRTVEKTVVVKKPAFRTITKRVTKTRLVPALDSSVLSDEEAPRAIEETAGEEPAKKLKKSKSKSKVKGEIKRSKSKSKVKDSIISDDKKKKKSKKDKKEEDVEEKKTKKDKKEKKDKKKKVEDGVEEKKSKKKSKKDKKETEEVADDSKPKKSKSKSKDKKDKKDKKSRRKSKMPAMIEEEYETDEEVDEEYETDEEQIVVEEVSDTEEQEFEEEVAYEEEEEYEEEVEEIVEREVEKEIEEMVEEEYEEEVVETSYEEPTAEQTRQVFDNTLEGVRGLRAEWNAYKTTTKAQKGVEKLNAAKLFQRIQEFLAANKRPEFQPHETPEDIDALWQKLEEGEKAYEAAIEDELARQEKLHSLSRSFNSEAQELESWSDAKLEYLDSEETVDTLDTARLKLMHLDVFDKEYAASHGRLGEVRELHDEIGRMNYVDHDKVAEKHGSLQTRWTQMQEKSAAKRAALEEAQKAQQAKEDLRIAFAEKAKAYVKFVKDNKERAGDTNFGLTLEAVQAFKQQLDQQDEEISSSSSAQVQALDDLQKQMVECEVTDNKHTTITKEDIARNSDELSAALEQRQAAYATELARQEAMEEKRKEFAGAATAFVSHLDERQTAIKALEGEPKELIAAIKSAYADGAAEQEKLDKLTALQEEMAKMGITENRHTKDNLASLGTKRDQLASFVKSYINTLSGEQELKEDYLSRTAALLAWIAAVKHDQDFDNTLEGARAQSTRWNEYKTTERAQKEIEKINLLELFEKIGGVLEAGHQRPSFSPEGHTPADINSAWDAMETADTEQESALESEIARQEKLASLSKSFKTEAEDIEKFLAEKENYLQSEEEVRSVDDSHIKIMHLDVFQEDYNANQARVGHLEGLSREISQLGHKDSDTINADHERIVAAWKNLQDMAEKKRGTLEGAKGTEQEREAARLAFAAKAAEYVQFVNDAKIHASDTNFGLTLETVRAFKATLDEEERSTLESNDSQVASLDQASEALAALNVSDNRHTSTTKEDISRNGAELKAALEQRQSAYATELARQEAMEEKRKEFAAAAAAFVGHLEERQTTIKALEGEPEPLIAAVREAYADGSPEQEKLDSLSSLLEEMAKMGITENAHTQHNLASLGTKRDQFAKFVKNYVSTLSAEKELKQEYLDRTAALLAWIAAVKHDQDFDNTLEGARAHSTRWNEYKTTERAQKEIEKINLLELFEKIGGVLEAGHQRPSFSPEGHTPADINSAWAGMVKAEQEHESVLEAETSRQEQLDASNKSFNREADQVLSYVKEKREQLSAKEDVDSLDRAHMKLMHHGVMEEEVAGNKARLDSLASTVAALKEGNFHQASTAEEKHNSVLAAWKELEELAGSNRSELAAAKEHQQEREGLRVAFAEKAQAYDAFCKDSIYSVNEHQFGTSLEEVQAYKATLDEDTASLKSKGAELQAAAEAAATALEDAGVEDNKHTSLTEEDIASSAAELDAALAARESAYNEELERLQGNDKECEKFAKEAEEFVAWIQSHKSALEAVAADATPVERKAAVDELYGSGTEADNRLAAVEEGAKSLQERGVFYNPKTSYTVHALRSIRKNLSDAVSNLLASIDEEHQLLTRGEALKQELAQKEELDRKYIEFETKFQELEIFLDAQVELLTETISPESVKEVEELQESCSQAIAAVASKEAEISELKASGEELSAAGVAVSAEPLVAKHQLATSQGADRTTALAEEHKRQIANDALCKEFADLAESLDGFLQVEAQVLSSLDGEPESQLEAVRERRQELSGKMESVQQLSELNDKMVDAEITTNSYSDLTYQAIRAQAEELENSQQDKEKLLEREIYLKNNSGVSAEQLDEFKEVFNYFDKNNRGVLSELEFKSVLQSLGEDPSDAELKTFMTELATEEGVPFDNFVSHMVARATDSNTEDEVLSAFRELANYKDFITEAEMRTAMDGEKVDYLISVMPKTDEGYDYATWAKQAYSR